MGSTIAPSPRSPSCPSAPSCRGFPPPVASSSPCDQRGRDMTLSKDDELLLNAYLDGELDSLEASRFEARLASEPALAAEIEAYRLLRAALRSDLAEDVPSPDL